MDTKTIRLNRKMINHKNLTTNPHRFSQEASIGYPTVRRYLIDQQDFDLVSGRVLLAILHKGMGLSAEEIANLRFGDIFEIVDDAQ